MSTLYGLAGINTRPIFSASVSIAKAPETLLGVAGVDRASLHGSVVGLAGNMNPELREDVAGHMDRTERKSKKYRRVEDLEFAERAAIEGFKQVVFFLDVVHCFCQDRQTKRITWRNGFHSMFDKSCRRRPLWIDSGAFRRYMELKRQSEAAALGVKHTRRYGAWSDVYEYYLECIEFGKVDAYISWDTIGDPVATRLGYERMKSDGFSPIPVYQVGAVWDPRATLLDPLPYAVGNEKLQAAAANAQRVFMDPDYQRYRKDSEWIAWGGLVYRQDIPVSIRHAFFYEIARLDPGLRQWGLGQACATIFNSCGQLGLLDGRFSADSSWWIHHANCEQYVLLEDGLLKNMSLYKTGAKMFIPRLQRMACNMTSLAAAAANHRVGLWNWPNVATIKEIQENPEAQLLVQTAARKATKQLQALFNANMPDLDLDIDAANEALLAGKSYV